MAIVKNNILDHIESEGEFPSIITNTDNKSS